MKTDKKFMQMALKEACKAEGFTSPNPAVGALIVKDGKIISSGFHRGPGHLHAETDAIGKAVGKTVGAEMYVTLEPCNHHGRTGPCTAAIINAGIKRVYYAVSDPNPRVRGGGQETLEKHGIQVIPGLCADEARHLLRFYLYFAHTGLPYVIAKYACSLDGKIATSSGESKWITGLRARREGHRLRNKVDAVCIGANTAIQDNPQLTVRIQGQQSKNPIRIVLDSKGRVPVQVKIFQPQLLGKTIVATTDKMSARHSKILREQGVEIVVMPENKAGRVDVSFLLRELAKRDVSSLLLEGGAQLLGAFFERRLVNEVQAFFAPKIIGGKNAPAAVGGLGFAKLADVVELDDLKIKLIGKDILITGYPRY